MNNKYSHTGENKKNFVQNMFDKISSIYDLFNHLTTFYTDKYWRYKFIRLLNVKNKSKIAKIEIIRTFINLFKLKFIN